MTDTYTGPERRWTTEFPASWRRGRLLVLTAVFVAVMLPLGYLVWSAHQAEQRANRAGRSVCELASAVDHLASTLDTGVALLITDDPVERAKLVLELRQVTAQAQAAQQRASAQCGLGSSTLRP